MITRTLKTLGAAVALLSVYGCATDTQPSGPSSEVTGTDTQALGDNVASCTGGGGWTSSSGALVIDCSGVLCPSHTVILAPSAAGVRVNGRLCATSAGATIALSAVKTISVLGAAATKDTFIADFTAGMPSGSLLAASAITFNGNEASSTTSPDVFVMKGSPGADNVTVGQVAATSQFDISLTASANVADIIVKNVGNTDGLHDHDPTMAFVLAAGNDVFSGMGYTNGATTVPAVGSQAGLSIYGGDGNDTITGGLYNDVIVGGTGNDTIKSASNDGADSINCGGDSGDLMDYSGRAAGHPVFVDMDSKFPSIFSSSLLGKTVPTAADSFTIQLLSSGSASTVTFAGTETTPAAFVSLINGAVGAQVASLVGPYMRIVSNGDQLVISGAQASEAGLSTTAAPASLPNADDGEAGEFDDVQSCNNLNGGADNDVLVGNSMTNAITGNAGDDVLNGGPVNATCANDKDVLTGSAGNDWFDMGAAADCSGTFAGGAGTDIVDYSQRPTAANCAITIKADGTASSGAQSVSGTCAAVETDAVGSDIEVQVGSIALANTMTGTANGDWLFGGGANDVIKGGAGDDVIYGGAGDDQLNGEAGNDTFYETADYPASGAGTNGLPDTLPSTLQYLGYKMWHSASAGPGYGNDVVNGGSAAGELNHLYFGTDATGGVVLSLCVDTNNDGDNVCKLDANYGPQDNDGIASFNSNDIVNIQWVSGNNGVAYTGTGTANVIIGTANDETFEGGSGLDVIMGQGGSDTLYGFADGSTDATSVDVLCGGDGSDNVFGGGAALVEGEGQFSVLAANANKVLASANTGNCNGGVSSSITDPSCCYAPGYAGSSPATITGDLYSLDPGGFDICSGYGTSGGGASEYDMCETH